MNTKSIPPSLTSKLPYWNELEKLSKEDKITLIAMLSLSITDTDILAPKKEHSKGLTLEQAMAFLDTIMVKDGKPVPVDEDGRGALARIKEQYTFVNESGN